MTGAMQKRLWQNDSSRGTLEGKSICRHDNQRGVEGDRGRLIRGESEKIFQGVSTDSRQMQEGNLFLCLRG